MRILHGFGFSVSSSEISPLARAYFFTSPHDPDNLDRAEASLNELFTSIDNSVNIVSRLSDPSGSYQSHSVAQDISEFQRSQWMRVAILKQRDAAGPQLLEGAVNAMVLRLVSLQQECRR